MGEGGGLGEGFKCYKFDPLRVTSTLRLGERVV